MLGRIERGSLAVGVVPSRGFWAWKEPGPVREMSWRVTLGNVTGGVSWVVGWRAGRFGSERGVPLFCTGPTTFGQVKEPIFLMDAQLTRNSLDHRELRSSPCSQSRTRCWD